MNETAFDSEVMSLIQDLGLVLKLSEEGKQWWTCWLISQYRSIPLCERYKRRVAQMERMRNIRMLRMYEVYRPYSCDKNDNELCVQGRLL